MARQLKVYGRTGWRSECPPALNGNQQTREIVATTTIKEAMRLFGCSRGEWNWSGCETGNAGELKLALSAPGVVFWKPIDAHDDEAWKRLIPPFPAGSVPDQKL